MAASSSAAPPSAPRSEAFSRGILLRRGYLASRAQAVRAQDTSAWSASECAVPAATASRTLCVEAHPSHARPKSDNRTGPSSARWHASRYERPLTRTRSVPGGGPCSTRQLLGQDSSSCGRHSGTDLRAGWGQGGAGSPTFPLDRVSPKVSRALRR